MLKTHPAFRVEKTNPPRVFLQCSECGEDIREIGQKETIRVTRAYYCEKCDPGVVVLNLPEKD